MTGWTPPDEGVLFVVSGPSGTGKTTLLRGLFDAVPGLEFSVSATTRPPRLGERQGVDYHFMSPEKYRELLGTGAFLESARVYDHGYGTLRAPVVTALSAGRSVVLDIDTQGAAQVRESMAGAVHVFILPPDREAMRARLVARGTDPLEVIERRLADADEQLRHCGRYDYLVMNDDLVVAQGCLNGIFLAEMSRAGRRRSWVQRFGGDP